MSRLVDMIGMRYGRLTVIERAESKINSRGEKQTSWLCQCDCGNLVVATRRALITGNTKSCGCLYREVVKTASKKVNKYVFGNDVVTGYTTNGDPFSVDNEDYPIIKDFCWRKNTDGYIVTTKNRTNLFLHRLLTAAGPGFVVDHINHDTTDNRRQNLRVVTQSQNMQNACFEGKNTSGIVGVNWDEKMKKWHARINVNKVTIELGYFEDFDDAAEARIIAEEKYFGEYSYTNSMALSKPIEVA